MHTQHDGSHLAGPGNGIILSATLEGCNAQRHFLLHTAKQLAHDLDGIGAVLVDLHTGVTALQAFHRQADARSVHRTAGGGQRDGSGSATGAGDGEDTLLLGVQVQKGASLQHGKVDHIRAQHTDLLVHSDDHLKCRMRHGGVCQDRQGISHSDTVIAAQSGTTGKNIFAVMGHIQAIGVHVDGTVLVLFAHHVHMPLEDHRRMVFIAGCGITEEDHIVGFVLDIAQAVSLGKVH